MQAELAGWLPVAVLREADDFLFRWMQFDETPFHEPFFDQSLARARWTYAFNRSRFHAVTRDELLLRCGTPAAEPDLLVFHISRCGSTLLTQLLGLDEQITTLAEVPLLDELLALPETTTSRTNLLRATVHLLRRNTRNLVIKCDSWHLLHYQTLRACFPQTPVVFLYRNPAEVWQSHVKLRGIHTVPGLLTKEQLPGFEFAGDATLLPGDYTGKLLALFFKMMLRHAADENVLLLNYNEGALPFTLKAAAHAGIVPDKEHLQQMHTRAAYNAKKPDEVFYEKQEQETVPVFLEEAVLLYGQLDELRK